MDQIALKVPNQYLDCKGCCKKLEQRQKNIDKKQE